ncbi:MAG: cytochrome b N-terminal domain-containing protein [Chloroflexi bacterium]|nr:cytochrome b N-terminal domain-containing protein [Chloroflexota bacterium]
MKPTNPAADPGPSTFLGRVRASLAPTGLPSDDRGRMRLVVDSLVLHLHPTKVNTRSLSLTYTWGLGGLSAMLVMILAFTGILLTNNYTPSPAEAYQSILNLRANVWFGDLLRNLHHWAANLLVLVAALHLLRVFFTGAFRPPRALNWLMGLALLLLVVAANFTGYLLPWDQLAYWAITVATSLLTYIPLIGAALSRTLLGGPEVGAATLRNFYSLHIGVIPASMILLMSFHFWRVRKDGDLSVPRQPDEPLTVKLEKVTTIPFLVRRELAFALIWLALLVTWSMWVSAPLEGIANPQVSPNPAKAAWYFLGLQELLLHFHPLVAALLIPGAALLGLAALPFADYRVESTGIYFRSRRGRDLAVLATGLALLITPIWVLLDEFVVKWSEWFPAWPTLITTGLLPLAALILGLLILDEFYNHLGANTEERILALVIFLTAAFIVLTAIGIFFRGPGMGLFWPWAMPAGHG